MEHKTYIGTKMINAHAMNRQEYNDFRGWTVPENEDPADEGYLVEYLDGGKPNTESYAGYVSWSPKEQFEKAYRPASVLPFGLAVEALKNGLAVARLGWNGKDMYVNLNPPYVDEAGHLHRQYMTLKTADGSIATWAPSGSDALAEDWVIVE
jgi:hypothetical protein